LARRYFLNAVSWARNQGASVVLLAAGTKRLFGLDGAELKEKFPEILFTIGDNGTMHLLGRETLQALDQAGLAPSSSRVAVLGPYGLLGEMMVSMLVQKGFELVGAGPNASALERVREAYGIQTASGFEAMGRVDAVAACTHSPKVRLTADLIRNNGLRRPDRKLLVVDVAEPSNLTRREYQQCCDVCIRQDAGNAYSPRLKYVLGAVSYNIFRLSRGVTFGCFAETLALAHALKHGRQDWVRDVDWFRVSPENMAKVADLFRGVDFQVPSPRCFGKPVPGYELSLPAPSKLEVHPATEALA
jgi:predicted amino acid dehydrogenase